MMKGPPVYRPSGLLLPKTGSQASPRNVAPPAYNPFATQTTQPKLVPSNVPATGCAPPVYRPQPMASAISMKPAAPAPFQPAAQTRSLAGPPPVYRPQASASQAKANAATNRMAPPVYRPVSLTTPNAMVQPKAAAANAGAHGTAPPIYRPNVGVVNRAMVPRNPPPAVPSSIIQPVILEGKTHRSQPIKSLKATAWYKTLSIQHQAFAVLLHSEDDEYTKPEANREIRRRIKKGDPTPSLNISAKKIRKQRVRAYINSHPPSAVASREGRILARAGSRAYKRHGKKYRRTAAYTQSVTTVGQTAPGLMATQPNILGGLLPWQQVHAVSHSQPQSYNFNLGGSEVTIDSLDVMSNVDRGNARPQTAVNLNQMFIEQPGGHNSYWSIADSGSRNLAQAPQHQQLRHLEVERKDESAFTTYTKDALYEGGRMDTEQAFGDENMFTYQEDKGALRPTIAMAARQDASGYYVLEHAMADANTELGAPVNVRPRSNPQQIRDALDTFMANQTEANYKILVKRIYRIIRAQTRMDIGSDTEADSDTDY